MCSPRLEVQRLSATSFQFPRVSKDFSRPRRAGQGVSTERSLNVRPQYATVAEMYESNAMKLSIAMATYNGEQFLAEQLQSFADQSFSPDELVVCDDQS